MAIKDNGLDLSIKANVRHIMAEHGIYAKKNLGQNFLTDSHVLSKIVNAADITADDFVIEVGPGLGVLTTEIAKKAAKVVAVEVDPNLTEILEKTLPPNVQVINQDILKTDIGAIITRSGFLRGKLVANLPYYITTPIIFAVLEQDLPIDSLVVMVQKEVADRMLAKPSTKAYGLLTLSIALYGKVSLVANVPPNSFFPRPDVHSAVVKIDVAPDANAGLDRGTFSTITKAAFANRRKTLQNCLANSDQLNLNKEQAAELLAKANLSENIRGEALSFDDFARLTAEYIILHTSL